MKRTPVKRRYTEEFVKALGERLLIWAEDPEDFWLGSFAVKNGMSRPRLQEIASVNQNFNLIYEIAKQAQENKLVVGALGGKINNTMAIFALKNVSGFRDMPAEKEDENLRGQELEFKEIPSNGKGKEAYSRYFN